MDAGIGLESLETIDPRLVAEALRRARGPQSEGSAETAAQLEAIVSAVQNGARDMYSLVAAARRASLPRTDYLEHDRVRLNRRD